MILFNRKISSLIFLLSFFLVNFVAQAQNVNIDASLLLTHVGVGLSPRSGSFTEGATFQVPILIDTKGASINGIEVHINYDKNKLSIVNPTGGTSIIGLWIDPPKFNNLNGTVSYIGVVPNGITTGSGLVGTITFKAIAAGSATVSVSSASRILLNDGLGTLAQVDVGRAEYSILAKAPEGVNVFSYTHPNQSDWYNNNTPVLSWVKDDGVSGFSFELDNKPNTIPDNVEDSEDTTKGFEKLNDGLWYFHIKAIKAGVWGATGHFLLRIDTTPPAHFTPETNYLVTAVILAERTLVSFFTTDNLSGVDHYEVGVIDKNQPLTDSPVFIQTESPFQLPFSKDGRLQVIVRAVDKANNVRDESIDIRMPFVITKFVQDYLVYILLGIIILGLVMLLIHYMLGYHIIRAIRRFRLILKNEKEEL